MDFIKTMWRVLSLLPAAALFSALAFASDTGRPSPDTTDGPARHTARSGEAHSLMVVDIGPETGPTTSIAAQACAGMFNRKAGGSVYTLMKDKDHKWIEELDLKPDQTMKAEPFLDVCMAEFPRCVRYSYEGQRELLPNILTVGAVLDAIPVDEKMDVKCGNIVFDAAIEFKERDTPYLATRYVYENHVNETTGLAMLNPGYDKGEGKVWDPEIVEDMAPSMVDYVFSEKMFVMFLVNGCVKCTRQNDLLNNIVSENPWPKPIGVYGYANYWNVFGGYLFEAQTTCSKFRNMGAVPTEVNNLSFFSTRRGPITGPGELKQNETEDIAYDPAKTYVAFIVGDGDNISFIMDSRAEWFRRRVRACREGVCPPLTWSISPHLSRIAPDVLEWYYEMSHKTGKDYFMLPPSGHLYAYPSSLEEKTIQDKFVAATEKDARLLGTNSTVHWEWFNNWSSAEKNFLPKYADGAIKGVFPVNVPYMFPTFTWGHNRFFKVLDGQDGGEVVLFRPREWRGTDESRGKFMDDKFYLAPEEMAEELGEYPRGTVTGIYMTSDGGLTIENSVMELIKLLPEHVRLVSADTAVRLALEAAETGEGR